MNAAVFGLGIPIIRISCDPLGDEGEREGRDPIMVLALMESESEN